MSVDRRTDLEVDVDDNRAVATVVEKRTIEVADLFNDDGELRLWQDTAGWSGYVRELVDSEPRYYSVNTRFDEDEWISETLAGVPESIAKTTKRFGRVKPTKESPKSVGFRRVYPPTWAKIDSDFVDLYPHCRTET